MSDTLKEMEQQLSELKNKLATLEVKYRSLESFGGTDVTYFEEKILGFIKNGIKRLESEILKRKEILKTVTIDDVKDYYSSLFNTIRDFASGDMNETYLEWQSHILTVGTCYATAYDTFKSTVEAQNKYKADLANIAASIISVAGIGTLSWLSTSGKLALVLTKLSKNQQNVAEDISQGIWDKAVSYAGTQWANTSKKDFTGPLVFQNKISQKVLDGYKAVLQEILKHQGAALKAEKVMLNKQTLNQGDPKKEFEKYLKFEANVLKTIGEIKSWTTKLPPSVSPNALTEDFERGFWSAWLPNLQYTVIERPVPIRDEFGIEDPNAKLLEKKVTKFDSWLSNALKNRLTTLLPLNDIDVDLWWTTQDEVKKMIDWAKGFKPTEIF